MKELKTVYIPESETHEYGLFFTQEEYNKHIEEVIKDALSTAVEKVTIDIEENRFDMRGQDYYTINKGSIINTLEQSYNKWKI